MYTRRIYFKKLLVSWVLFVFERRSVHLWFKSTMKSACKGSLCLAAIPVRLRLKLSVVLSAEVTVAGFVPSSSQGTELCPFHPHWHNGNESGNSHCVHKLLTRLQPLDVSIVGLERWLST